MKSILWAGVAGLALLMACTAAGTVANKSLDNSVQEVGPDQDTVEKAGQEALAHKEDGQTFFDVTEFGPQVVPFTTQAAAQALAKTQTVVYFFNATWCVECQETYKDLKANWKTLPKDFTLVYVNYDKEAQLKMKYGVVVQHTFVVIGPRGEKKKIWVGTVPIAEIVRIAELG